MAVVLESRSWSSRGCALSSRMKPITDTGNRNHRDLPRAAGEVSRSGLAQVLPRPPSSQSLSAAQHSSGRVRNVKQPWSGRHSDHTAPISIPRSVDLAGARQADRDGPHRPCLEALTATRPRTPSHRILVSTRVHSRSSNSAERDDGAKPTCSPRPRAKLRHSGEPPKVSHLPHSLRPDLPSHRRQRPPPASTASHPASPSPRPPRALVERVRPRLPRATRSLAAKTGSPRGTGPGVACTTTSHPRECPSVSRRKRERTLCSSPRREFLFAFARGGGLRSSGVLGRLSWIKRWEDLAESGARRGRCRGKERRRGRAWVDRLR